VNLIKLKLQQIIAVIKRFLSAQSNYKNYIQLYIEYYEIQTVLINKSFFFIIGFKFLIGLTLKFILMLYIGLKHKDGFSLMKSAVQYVSYQGFHTGSISECRSTPLETIDSLFLAFLVSAFFRSIGTS